MVANVSFDYNLTNITDFRVHSKENEKTGKRTVTGIEANDELYESSDRFWTSLMARYGFSGTIFKYFDYDEVFERIQQRATNGDTVRTCIERSINEESGKPINRIMGVSNNKKPYVEYGELTDLLGRYGNNGVSYDNGEVQSIHTPRIGSNRFDICGDAFQNQFVVSTPIDGYGKPSFYLSLLREICTNGLVGFAPAFKSQLQLGKTHADVMPTILRALDSFNNDEGFADLRQRIEAASKSHASVNEALKLYKLIVKMHNDEAFHHQDTELSLGTTLSDLVKSKGSDGSTLANSNFPLLGAFHKMTGDIHEDLGISNIDAISVKRQRMIPVRCKVYDLLNFATEAATHYTEVRGQRRLNAFVGSLIAEEGGYDMEGTADEIGDFEEFMIRGKIAAKVTG